jgi:hypothetical protein
VQAPAVCHIRYSFCESVLLSPAIAETGSRGTLTDGENPWAVRVVLETVWYAMFQQLLPPVKKDRP